MAKKVLNNGSFVLNHIQFEPKEYKSNKMIVTDSAKSFQLQSKQLIFFLELKMLKNLN